MKRFDPNDDPKFARVTGAPLRLARLRFADLECSDDLYRDALERLAEVATELRSGALPNLVLSGPFGTGKTRIATHLLRMYFEASRFEVYDAWQWPRFFTARDVAELRFARAYGGAEDEEDAKEVDRDALRRSPLVAIDDLGRIAGYRGEETFVESVVERRYEAEFGTILTMNTVPTEGRFADFLRYFEEVSIVGSSHRG